MKSQPLLRVQAPTVSRDEFNDIIQNGLATFPMNKLCRKVDDKKIDISDYHGLLNMIFHQTYQGPGFLAIAGAHCPRHQLAARDYLFKHADEEKHHWKWVLNDLENTGYRGPDPRGEFPPAAAQAYIAYNYYISTQKPVARLAIALMLESLGATFGKKYALQFCQSLSLKQSQVTFFMGHSDTDVIHTQELWEVVDACQLKDDDWAWMCNAAATACKLYYRMYEESVK